jgi:putative flippase GtrA
MNDNNSTDSSSQNSEPKKASFAVRFHGIILFLKASVAAQIASYIDMGIGILLPLLFHIDIKIATAIGAVTGGIINCSINYKWTFKANACSVPAVVTKYIVVWVGSLLLNVYGTALLYNAFATSETLANWGIRAGVYTTVARVSTSLIVSIFWNFLLQRYFVYHYNKVDTILNKAFSSIARTCRCK